MSVPRMTSIAVVNLQGLHGLRMHFLSLFIGETDGILGFLKKKSLMLNLKLLDTYSIGFSYLNPKNRPKLFSLLFVMKQKLINISKQQWNALPGF